MSIGHSGARLWPARAVYVYFSFRSTAATAAPTSFDRVPKGPFDRARQKLHVDTHFPELPPESGVQEPVQDRIDNTVDEIQTEEEKPRRSFFNVEVLENVTMT